MSDSPDSVADEPAFAAQDRPAAADGNGVWDEPALESCAAADPERDRRRQWLDRQWRQAGRAAGVGTFALHCAAAGLFAIVCSLLREAGANSVLSVAAVAPVCEEMAKVALPLATLERRPWAFRSAAQLIVACAVSGLVFASIENALYLNLYLAGDRLTAGIVLWRLVVCTALHVACASVSGFGLARAWLDARAAHGTFSAATATPWIVAAIVAHGVYNAGAMLYGFAAH